MSAPFHLKTMLLGLAIIVGCTIAPAAGQGGKGTAIVNQFDTISSSDLAGMMRAKDFILVNVHIPYEGEIAGTDAFIPFDRIAGELGRLPSDKDQKIVLYCMSGRMSEIAAEQLTRFGYRNVFHVSGGMIGWQKDGGRLLRP